MFDTTGPRLFAMPPGVDFPTHLVAGLQDRMRPHPPEAMAGVTLFLNTTRMLRRVTEIFTTSGAHFLPRLRLVTDLGVEMPFAGLPAAVSPLRRRLELTVLIDRLLTAQPDLAPRSSLFDLADSLADLMDEMQGEGVDPQRVASLDVTAHSEYWARTQAFLAIIAQFFAQTDAPDTQARQRMVIERLTAQWAATPPQGPMIVAGSTGSRGNTALLMQAVARLPQGAIILPGFDFDMPAPVWDALSDAMTAEDHPQYRFRRVLQALALPATAVQAWRDVAPPSVARNRLISLSLRPAPVTDQWLTEGADLPDLITATTDMTLIETASPRAEAMAIALVLREAAETGVKAALITPDRNLTRQVSAALDRWAILPDDSAGSPLALSAPGRLLRHVAEMSGRKLTAEALLTLLKHPLAFTGQDRGNHLRRTRDLELHLRRNGPAFPTAPFLLDWAQTQRGEGAVDWAMAITSALDGLESVSDMALLAHVTQHRRVAEAAARGTAPLGSGGLWAHAAGEAALALFAELESEAPYGGTISPADYTALFAAVVAGTDVREAPRVHPHIMLWGTLEARVQGADLVILGGMTDGIWPPAPPADPWLNRKMRAEAGLLLPERKIGLSAHDYQQAVAAPRVILTRALRNAEAETVPSRWLNRLINLLTGLPDRNGPQALAAMRARGAAWAALAMATEAPVATVRPAHRPSPRPPAAARPDRLSLTNIERLIRDPYAIYARHILRLYKLDPLRHTADARLRGSVIHKILETFTKTRPDAELPDQAHDRLLMVAQQVLAETVPWPTARAVWAARMARAAAGILALDASTGGTPVAVEEMGSVLLAPLPFTLFGTPDRIDALPDGRLHLIDYKTGEPPSEKKQAAFEKQLLLAAAMAEQGGFRGLGPREVAKITYLGIKGDAKSVETVMTPDLTGRVWEDLHKLIGSYLTPTQGYTARRAMFETAFPGDYDHLSRLGEWDMTDAALPEDVG
ncbi:MAG: double-strand break repair protein AddB [Pseudomonadota bacterium]